MGVEQGKWSSQSQDVARNKREVAARVAANAERREEIWNIDHNNEYGELGVGD